ncbi:MAG: metallopeptidase family protein [wastewater metagenome]|nr:metallopeptidase family protein [Candidatus Loosdrechtia aerotolerans]
MLANYGGLDAYGINVGQGLSLAEADMEKGPDVLRCLHCGKTYHRDQADEKKGLVCISCGLKLFPLTVKKSGDKNTKDLSVVLGYFTVTALLGGLGGVMIVHGWNIWTTFAIIGGILYFTGKIFVGKYRIHEAGEHLPEETHHNDDHDSKHKTVFDQLVIDAIKELPYYIRNRLSNISIVVEDRPGRAVLEKLRMKPNRILLGLFEGVPLNKRSVWHSGTMPEKITLFQKNIEGICHSDEEMKTKIREVVYHELAHFVGFTEEEIRNLGY